MNKMNRRVKLERDVVVDASFYSDMWRQNENLDVTFALEDETEIKAHKLILSAHSPKFRRFFNKYTEGNKIIFMKGVSYAQFRPILDFIYNGSIELEERRLDQFLSIGKDLEVKGIVMDGNPTTKKTSY